MKKYLFFVIGLMIIALGVNFALSSNFGIAPWDAINFGLSDLFNLSTGVCVNIVSVILLTLVALISKKRIHLQCFVTATVLGLGIDFFGIIFNGFEPTSMLIRICVFSIGLILISLGLCIYLSTNLPQNTIDYVMVVVKEKFKLRTMNAKLIVDILCIVVAVAFNGPIGIGTILLAFCAGPLVGFFEKRLGAYLRY